MLCDVVDYKHISLTQACFRAECTQRDGKAKVFASLSSETRENYILEFQFSVEFMAFVVQGRAFYSRELDLNTKTNMKM